MGIDLTSGGFAKGFTQGLYAPHGLFATMDRRADKKATAEKEAKLAKAQEEKDRIANLDKQLSNAYRVLDTIKDPSAQAEFINNTLNPLISKRFKGQKMAPVTVPNNVIKRYMEDRTKLMQEVDNMRRKGASKQEIAAKTAAIKVLDDTIDRNSDPTVTAFVHDRKKAAEEDSLKEVEKTARMFMAVAENKVPGMSNEERIKRLQAWFPKLMQWGNTHPNPKARRIVTEVMTQANKKENAPGMPNLAQAANPPEAQGSAKGKTVFTDPITGSPSLIDKATGRELPVARIGQRQQQQSPQQTESMASMTGEELIDSIKRKRVILSPEQLTTGTGFGSNIRQGFSSLMGVINWPGEVAPKTSEAKNAIKSFNQMVKTALTVNSRNPVRELETIQDFLPDENSYIQDKDANVTKMINLVKRLESDVVTFKDLLNDGHLSKQGRIELMQKVTARVGILTQLPTTAALKIHVGRPVNTQELATMSLEELVSYPKKLMTEELLAPMIQRIEELEQQQKMKSGEF